MKRNLASLPITAAVLFLAVIPTAAQKAPSAEAVLQRTAKKLATVKFLGYTYTRELNYASEDYRSKETSVGYIELRPVDSLHGFRYQYSDDDYIGVYNGAESFIAVKKKKVMVVTNKPERNRVESSAFLYNSPLTLKYALPKILADKKIPKTLSVTTGGGRRHYVVQFALYKATLSGLGDIREIKNDRTSIYSVTIDAATYLPTEVLLTNDKNKDFTKTTFTSLTEKPKVPGDASWYFSSYTNEYKIEQPNSKKLLEVGKTPPPFVLKQFENEAQVALDNYKGKVVLLEFWIAHCGFCIAAVPKLNAIAGTYRSSGLEVISINLHDQAKTIASFKNRLNPNYPILMDGEPTGDAYGVGAYPAIVLIGKDGKVAYSSLGLFEKELEPAIKASLEK